MNNRNERWQGIKDNPQYPVVIAGGGINGIGLFRELALQGVDCLLIDKSDFVAGSSSKSSRMIHGGLRYLENAEFRLVREALHERNLLIDNAPHYVSPLRTTIPLFSWLGGMIKSPLIFFGLPVKPGGRGAMIVKGGLTFYDFVTRKHRRTPRNYLSSKQKALRDIPGLNPNIVAAATYWDARITQAERLCIEMIQDALKANPNCRALNYVRLDGAEKDAVVLKDEVSGESVPVKLQVLVNATGAWVDVANAAIGLETKFMGGTKGSHLVIDNRELFDALGGQMVYYEHGDGRVCIVFGFMDKVIMGSTDIHVDDPDEARCDEDEISYMFETLRDVFPGLKVSRGDVVYKFCGVRPLPAASGEFSGKTSRDHSIETTEPDGGRTFPVLSLIGGKLTTFRAFAEQTADAIMSRLGVERKTSTEHIPLGGGRDFPSDEAARAR